MSALDDMMSAREHLVRHGIPAALRSHYIIRARVLRAEAIRAVIRQCARLLLLRRRARQGIGSGRPPHFIRERAIG